MRLSGWGWSICGWQFSKEEKSIVLKTFKCFHRLKPLKTFPEATSSTRHGRNKQYRLNIRLLKSPTPLTLPLIFWLFYGWRVAHLLPSYHNLRRRTAGETRRQTLGHKRNNWFKTKKQNKTHSAKLILPLKKIFLKKKKHNTVLVSIVGWRSRQNWRVIALSRLKHKRFSVFLLRKLTFDGECSSKSKTNK